MEAAIATTTVASAAAPAGFEPCLPVISRLCDLVEGVGAGWRGKKIRRHLNLLSVRGSSGVARWDKERGRGLKQRFVLHCSLSPRTEKSLREHNEEELQKNAELSRLRLEPPAAFLSPPALSAPPTFPAVLKSTSNFGHRVIKFKQSQVTRKYKKETQSSKTSNRHFRPSH